MMFSYGSCAYNLVKKIKQRRELLENPFDEHSKKQITEEICFLFYYIERQVELLKRELDSLDQLRLPYFQIDILVHHCAILRNKQCMLAYLMGRLNMIKELRWELSSELLPQEIQHCLSPSEHKFRAKYNDNLREYINSINLDLTLNLYEPPTSYYIDVLILKDHGYIVVEDGTILLKKDTIITMKRSDAEPLIKLGIAKHVNFG